MVLGLPLPFALLVLGQDTVSHCARRPIGHPGGFGILAVKRHSDTLPLLCPKNCRKKECTRSILVIISLYIYTDIPVIFIPSYAPEQPALISILLCWVLVQIRWAAQTTCSLGRGRLGCSSQVAGGLRAVQLDPSGRRSTSPYSWWRLSWQISAPFPGPSPAPANFWWINCGILSQPTSWWKEKVSARWSGCPFHPFPTSSTIQTLKECHRSGGFTSHRPIWGRKKKVQIPSPVTPPTIVVAACTLTWRAGVEIRKIRRVFHYLDLLAYACILTHSIWHHMYSIWL